MRTPPGHVTSMSKANHVKNASLISVGSPMLVALLTAATGVLGSDVQRLAVVWLWMLVVSSATYTLGLLLLADWSRARMYFRRREDSSAGREDAHAVGGVDDDTDRLRSNLALMHRDEDSCVQRYSQRRCSVEDMLRAKSLRLQAEIALIRHEKQPKSWAEVCAEYHSRDDSSISSSS